MSLNKREETLKNDTKTKVEIETKRKNLAKEIIEMVENEG